jgi:hypothetical protein
MQFSSGIKEIKWKIGLDLVTQQKKKKEKTSLSRVNAAN